MHILKLKTHLPNFFILQSYEMHIYSVPTHPTSQLFSLADIKFGGFFKLQIIVIILCMWKILQFFYRLQKEKPDRVNQFKKIILCTYMYEYVNLHISSSKYI